MLRKSIFNILFALLTLCAMTACRHSDEPAPATERTILVYMVANNTLGAWGYDAEDLAEMQKAATSGHFGKTGRLIAYHAPSGGAPELIEITRQGQKQLKSYSDEVYSTDPDRLREVLVDLESLAPANGYGLVFWSHADGWLNGTSATDNRYKAFGDDRGHYMKLSSLASALSGRTFDFIYFDCCLMGNIESVWELRNASPYIIASPTELSVHGMPYHLTLQHLFLDEPDLTAAARTTYQYYRDNADFNERTCQISVISTAALDGLASASAAILSRLTAYPGNMQEVQSMSVPGKTRYHVDMGDYYRILADKAGAPELYDAWLSAKEKAVVAAFTTEWGIGSLPVDKYSGLATYPVCNEASLTTRGYDTTAWYRDVLSATPIYGSK